jgi:Tfp pilus assembly pilus retraction ATPase PilT
MINITVDSGDIVASLALLFSVYATFKTIQFNNRQQEVIKSQAKLNELLLNKEAAEVELEKQADLGAAFLKLGNSRYRLKVFNKGKAPALHVTIVFPEGNEIVSESEINSKFPLQFLDVHQNVELVASVYLGTKPKHLVTLEWDDGRPDRAKKEMWVTL